MIWSDQDHPNQTGRHSDGCMPRMDGIEATRRIKAECLLVRIIKLSVQNEEPDRPP